MNPKVENLLYDSPNSHIYLWEHPEFDDPVVLKVLKTKHPSPKQIIQFNNEFHFTKDLNIKGIRKGLGKTKFDDRYGLFLQYIQGITLKEWAKANPSSIRKFLSIAISLAHSMESLYRIGIIHKDINPKNILIDDELNPTIIDFGISTKLDLKTTNVGNPDLLEGTLAYMSPEQTGRMNRKLDYRTDMYSLGVTFYEMLTGHLPFEVKDSLEIVHSHIARQPKPICELNPDLPKPLEAVVSKMMAKNADDRYQSYEGLGHDLMQISELLKSPGQLDSFQPGKSDFVARFSISQQLYGRDEEIQQLTDLYDQSATGSCNFAVIAGYSGVGKSALVNELLKPVTASKGFFISGKFDQYQRDIPYFALVQAFNNYIDLLLLESQEKLDYYRQIILEAVGDHGAVLLEVIPELEKVIGEQIPVEELEPHESMSRFTRIFTRFIRSISRAEHPLAVFIDDLQWADNASLNLLKQLILDPSNNYLLWVGAYRDNEVDQDHALQVFLDQLANENANITDIKLSPLKFKDVLKLVADSLKTGIEDAAALSQVIYSKTLGNAFFTIEFMKSLFDQKMITYDFNSSSFKADLAKIQEKKLTDNVVELMTGKIKHFPENVQEVLKIASCIGLRFDINTIASHTNEGLKLTMDLLWFAMKEGVVEPIGEQYKMIYILDEENILEIGTIEFKFIHDRILQAAYNLLTEDELQRIHLNLGRTLVNSSPNIEDDIFKIVNQYNQGSNLISKSNEQIKLAQLNLMAANRAKESTAFEGGVLYIDKCLSLLTSNSWSDQYDLSFKAHLLGAELFYLTGDVDRSEKTSNLCLIHAKTSFEKSFVHTLIMRRYNVLSKFDEAIEAGRKSLKELGIHLPTENYTDYIVNKLGAIESHFEENGVLSIYELPDAEEQENLAIAKILDNMSAPTYVSGQLELWTVCLLDKIQHTLKNGHDTSGSFGFAELGLTYCIQNNYKYVSQLGELAVKLARRYELRSSYLKARSFNLLGSYLFPWIQHIKKSEGMVKEALVASRDSGEMVYQGYSLFHSFYNPFYQGAVPLDQLNDRLPEAISQAEKIDHSLAFHALTGLEMFVANLTGKTPSADSFDSGRFNHKTFMQHARDKKDFYGISIYDIFKSRILYLNGFYKEALNTINESQDIAAGMTTAVSTKNLIQSLSLLALWPGMNVKEREEAENQIETNQNLMSVWVEQCPDNFEHKFLLVKAELEKVKGREMSAIKLYRSAIDSANKYDFPADAALIHERFGQFWIDNGFKEYAKIHFAEAVYHYNNWGSNRKVEQINSRFPSGLLRDEVVETDMSATLTAHSTGTVSYDRLDVLSTLKASIALTDSLILKDLLERMSTLLMENAGADKLVILIRKKNEWLVRAVTSNDSTEIDQNLPFTSFTDLSHPIINYVIRTNEEFIVKDAVKEERLNKDEYIQKNNVRSVLAMPFIHKGNMFGIAYFENHMIPNAFKANRLEILRVLCAQIAVAIENANYYENIKKLNASYERFVPHEFISTLGHDSITNARLGDQIQDKMTILFNDIRDYTTLSEIMTPAENFNFINAYLKRIGPDINRHNGFINQFLGDGIMALFPTTTEDAIKASIDMMKTIQTYNQHRIKKSRVPIQAGIGLHTGELMLGIIGDEKRQDTGVISDAVNTASRIEQLTKLFGTSIIVSDHVLKLIENPSHYHIRYLGKVQVKGKKDILGIYEIFDGDEPEKIHLKSDTLADYSTGIEHYFKKEFVRAAEYFKKVLDKNPDDLVVKRYFKSTAHLMVQDVSESWTGVEKLS